MKITQIKTSTIISNHETAQQYIASLPDPESMSTDEVIDRITTLTKELKEFWSSAYGWAPIEASQLLDKSRLDWQYSLSMCLKIWSKKASEPEQAGYLILGWTNLGSLVEGTLKLFLSVYYTTYQQDMDAIKNRRGDLREPDALSLEPLRQFFKKKIWNETWDNWIQNIQYRRNSIHAYKSRDLGTYTDFIDDLRTYLQLLRYVNSRLPYPDKTYIPQEIQRENYIEKSLLSYESNNL